MTITTDRKDLFSFTQPYYYTPAYLAASTRSGVTSSADLPFELPEGAEAITRPTDANCIEDIEAGRTEFDLLMTSGTVIDGAIDSGQPIVKIGDPVYQETCRWRSTRPDRSTPRSCTRSIGSSGRCMPTAP